MTGTERTKRRVLVVGAGERVRADVLPVLALLSDRYELAGVRARSARTVESGGATVTVESLDELSAATVAGCDLVYVAVRKEAVPAVLGRLAAFDLSHADLLIETPVLLFKHLSHLRRIGSFRAAWAAEDTSALPWLDTLRAASALVGEPREVLLDRSAWRYHGLAMMKTLLRSERVTSARRRDAPATQARIDLRFAGGARGRLLEPRDYAVGHFVLSGSAGALTDSPRVARELGLRLLEPIARDGACAGFRLGAFTTELDQVERELLGPLEPGATVTSMMQAAKRVGLYRHFVALHAGRGAYPLIEALDDMAIDYLLEKLGRYVATPLTSLRTRPGRALLAAAMRFAARQGPVRE